MPGSQGSPPVQVMLSSGRRERAVVVLLHMVALVALAGGLLARHLPDAGLMIGDGGWVVQAVALVAAGTAGAMLGARLLVPASGCLAWDGQRWRWSAAADGEPARARTLDAVDLRLDLGIWMLLRLRPVDNAPARWCGLSRRDAGAGWHALRLALYQPSRKDRP